MNPVFITLIVVGAAGIAFFLAGRKIVAWLLLLAGLLASGLGVAAVHLIEKGPQSVFAHVPLSPTRVAWLGSILALAGFGVVVGILLRTCKDAFRKPR